MTDSALPRLGAVSGSARDISLTLTGLSYRQTDAGRRYPYGEFGQDFIDVLHKGLAAPRHKGFFRSLVCPACGTALDGIPNDRVSGAAQLEFRKIPPIR